MSTKVYICYTSRQITIPPEKVKSTLAIYSQVWSAATFERFKFHEGGSYQLPVVMDIDVYRSVIDRSPEHPIFSFLGYLRKDRKTAGSSIFRLS